MLILISYDIVKDRRRTKIASLLEDFGRRVQYSVFECLLEESGLGELVPKLEALIDEEEDSVRIYRLCARCQGRVEILGEGAVTKEPEVYVL